MRIRAITVGIDARRPIEVSAIRSAGEFLRSATRGFADAGFEVQTVRLVTTPVAEVRPDLGPDEAWAIARGVESVCAEENIGFVSVGPIRQRVLGRDVARAFCEALPDLIGASDVISASIETGASGSVYAEAAALAGRVIARLAAETPEGFGNFRFGAIAECPGGNPFFPTAYHAGGPPMFSLGFEAAGVVRQAFAEVGSIAALTDRLAERFGEILRRVESVAERLEGDFGISYAGADLTPAPFPTDDISAGGMLEDLGVDQVGAAGTLTAAATLTRMLKSLPFRQVGFSGLMFPVLEDSILAERSKQGMLTWPELLLWSAVCGTGLDTVPLPGDTSAEVLGAIALDVASLAVALRKPLTCRLLPVPGKAAGDLTDYDFPYFANGRVLEVRRAGATRLFERLGE